MSPRASRLLPAFLLAAAASVGQTVLVDRVAASVNDIAIPESALRRAMLLSPLEREPGETADVFRFRVLDALIDQRLQYEDALRFGPEPPDAAEIEAAMAKVFDRLQAEGKVPAEEIARAGLTEEEVRASIERQLVVQRYIRERFRPVALAEEERARVEYDEHFVPERRAAGLPVTPFDQVAGQMRERSQQRVIDEEVDKWIQELRDKARITIYPPPATPTGQGVPIVIATAPARTRTPAPSR